MRHVALLDAERAAHAETKAELAAEEAAHRLALDTLTDAWKRDSADLDATRARLAEAQEDASLSHQQYLRMNEGYAQLTVRVGRAEAQLAEVERERDEMRAALKGLLFFLDRDEGRQLPESFMWNEAFELAHALV